MSYNPLANVAAPPQPQGGMQGNQQQQNPLARLAGPMPRFIYSLIFLALAACPASSGSMSLMGAGSSGTVIPSPQIDLNFATATYTGCASLGACLTVARASNATDLIPTSTSGYAYNTYASNVLAVSPGKGLLSFPAATNQLLNSTAPATQTTGSLANGAHTLWVNGSGSATMSAGTATGCGTGVATNGTPVTFTTSGTAGTCTVTVIGSLNAFQLEAGAFGTSFIVTAGATATRAADVISTAGILLTDLSAATFSIFISTPGMLNTAGGVLFSFNTNAYVFFIASSTTAFISAPVGNTLITAGGGSLAGLVKMVATTDGSGLSGVMNAGTVGTQVNPIGTSTSQWVGIYEGVSLPASGTISEIKVWTSRLSNSIAAAATQ